MIDEGRQSGRVTLAPMLSLIDQLIRHKWWANDRILHAVEQYDPACDDPELRKLLHHILVANRYWLLLTLGRSFDDEVEKRIPESHEEVIAQFAQTERLEIEWLSELTTEQLERRLQPRALPDITITVEQAALQACLHSQGHRSQCATRLRALGGTPAPMDFVLWIRDHGLRS